MSHVRVRARSVRRESEELRTTISRVYGYQAECRCGWKGCVWGHVRDARLEGTFHECERAAA